MKSKNYVDKIHLNERETKEKNIKDVLKDFFDYYHIDANLSEEDIIAAWREITGELINKLTTKIFVENNNLYVKLAKYTWSVVILIGIIFLILYFRYFH